MHITTFHKLKVKKKHLPHCVTYPYHSQLKQPTCVIKINKTNRNAPLSIKKTLYVTLL